MSKRSHEVVASTHIVWPHEILCIIVESIIRHLATQEAAQARVQHTWLLSMMQCSRTLWSAFAERWNTIKLHRWCVACRKQPARARVDCSTHNADCLVRVKQYPGVDDSRASLCLNCIGRLCNVCDSKAHCRACYNDDWRVCNGCGGFMCRDCSTHENTYRACCESCCLCCRCDTTEHTSCDYDSDSCVLDPHDDCLVHMHCYQCDKAIGKEDFCVCDECDVMRCPDCINRCSVCGDNYRCDECNKADRDDGRPCVCTGCFEELGWRAYCVDHCYTEK